MPAVLAAARRPGGRRVAAAPPLGAGVTRRRSPLASCSRCSPRSVGPRPRAAGQPPAGHRRAGRRPRERRAVPPVGVGAGRRGARAVRPPGRERGVPRRRPGARPEAHRRPIDARGDRGGRRTAWRARPGRAIASSSCSSGTAPRPPACARFNLPGPDLTAAEFARLLDRLAAQPVVFVNTASSSGGFVAALSGKDRTIITATKTDGERNQTRFGEFFAEALRPPTDADSDKDGRVSVLEAFVWARRARRRLVQAGRPAAHRARRARRQRRRQGHATRPASPAATARWRARCSCRPPRAARRDRPTRPIRSCARSWRSATRSKRRSPR